MADFVYLGLHFRSWREFLRVVGYQSERTMITDESRLTAWLLRRLQCDSESALRGRLVELRTAYYGLTGATALSADAQSLLAILVQGASLDALARQSGLDYERLLRALNELKGLYKGFDGLKLEQQF